MTELVPMPTPEPFQTRAARQREEARERARKSRERHAKAAEMGAAILRALVFEAGLRVKDRKVLVRDEKVDLTEVVATAAFQMLGPGEPGPFRKRKVELAEYLASYAEDARRLPRAHESHPRGTLRTPLRPASHRPGRPSSGTQTASFSLHDEDPGADVT